MMTMTAKHYEGLDAAVWESCARGSLHVCAGFKKARSPSLPVRQCVNIQKPSAEQCGSARRREDIQ